jgi:hypothetical protein
MFSFPTKSPSSSITEAVGVYSSVTLTPAKHWPPQPDSQMPSQELQNSRASTQEIYALDIQLP